MNIQPTSETDDVRGIQLRHKLIYILRCPDFVQMNNWLGPDPQGVALEYYGRSQSELISRLDALLMVVKTCKEDSCRIPWSTLFPDSTVTDLEAAMNPTFDAFFANQPKISFSSCNIGNVISDQGPQNVNVFSASQRRLSV